MLRLRGVRAGYGSLEVLHGLDLDVPAGAVTALLGPNGAGKTTTLATIAGLVALASGELTWDGGDLAGRTAFERARDGILLVPEQRGIFPGLTVRDNLRVFARDEDLTEATGAFPVLAQRQDQLAGSLSGGEQQMLAMSRVLLQQPSLLLLDEISAGLAPRVTAQLLEVVAQVAASGTTVLLVEQYLQDALRLADVVYLLERGEVAFAGEPWELAHKD